MVALIGVIFSIQTLNYENPGLRLELLLKELSKQSGQELRCSQTLKNEVIACSFENQLVEEVKEKLATVVHATWNEKNGVATLAQTEDQKREEYRWHQKGYFRYLGALLKGYELEGIEKELTLSEADQLGKLKSMLGDAVSQDRDLVAKMNRLSPYRRLMARVVKKLKPEYFGPDSLSIGHRVFSFEERPFTTTISIDIKQEMEMFEREMELTERFQNQQNAPKGRSVFTITVSRNLISVPELQCLIARNNRYLGEKVESDLVRQLQNPEVEEFPEPKEIKILAKALRTSINLDNVDSVDSPTEQLTERIRQVRKSLLIADKVDPLAHVEGARWIAFSKFKGRPIIASLSESQLSGVPSVASKDHVRGEIRIDDPSWLLCRPVDPLGNRRWRIDRSIAKRVYESCINRGSKTTLSQKLQDQYAQFIALRLSSGVPYVNPFTLDALGEDSAIFALYQSLTPNTRRRLDRGEAIPLSKLESTNPDVLRFWLQESVKSSTWGIDRDPLSEASFSASLSRVPVFIVENKDYSQDLEIRKAAFWLNDYRSPAMRQKDIETMKIWCEMADSLKIKIGSGEGYTVKLRSEVSKTTTPYTYATLPPKLKAEMERAFGSN